MGRVVAHRLKGLQLSSNDKARRTELIILLSLKPCGLHSKEFLAYLR
jgi:hypothetical protein